MNFSFQNIGILFVLFTLFLSSCGSPNGDKESEIISINETIISDVQEKEDVLSINIANSEMNKTIATVNTYTQKGIEWYQKLNFQNARDFFIQSKDDDVVALYYLGLISSYEDDSSLAKSYFKKVIKNTTNRELMSDAQEIITAYSVFDTYSGAKQDFLYTLLGKAYVNVGQASLGILKLKQAVTINPKYNDAWILLGTAYILAENYTEAKNAFRKVTDLSRPETSYYLGLSEFNQKNYKEAIVAYREALDRGYQPAADVYEDIAVSFLALHKNSEALRYYLNAIQSDPKNPSRYTKAIWMQITLFKDLDEAASLATDAIKNNPHSAMAYNFMAWVSLEKNDLKSAKQYLDTALSLDSELQAVFYNYGRYFEKISDIKAAINQYQKAISIDPSTDMAKKAASSIVRLK